MEARVGEDAACGAGDVRGEVAAEGVGPEKDGVGAGRRRAFLAGAQGACGEGGKGALGGETREAEGE